MSPIQATQNPPMILTPHTHTHTFKHTIHTLHTFVYIYTHTHHTHVYLYSQTNLRLVLFADTLDHIKCNNGPARLGKALLQCARLCEVKLCEVV